MRAVVALVEARPETIIEDYDRVIRLAQLDGLFRDGPVALVPQARAGGWFPGSGSPPWQLDGVLTWLEGRRNSTPDAAGTGQVAVLPTSPSGGPASSAGWAWDDVMAIQGAEYASEHFRNLRSFRAEPALPALEDALSGPVTLPAGLRDRPTLLLPVPMLQADRSPCGSLDLLGGLLVPEWKKFADEGTGEIMGDVIRFAGQALPNLGVVMDAVWWQLGSRPATGPPVARNILLAGKDPVAVDAVVARLAGRDPERDPRFRWWRDQQLGAVREGDIRVTGRTDLLDLDFGVPDRATAPGALGWEKIPFTDRIERRFKRSSLIKQHARTPWGELFEAYRAGGPVRERG